MFSALSCKLGLSPSEIVKFLCCGFKALSSTRPLPLIGQAFQGGRVISIPQCLTPSPPTCHEPVQRSWYNDFQQVSLQDELVLFSSSNIWPCSCLKICTGLFWTSSFFTFYPCLNMRMHTTTEILSKAILLLFSFMSTVISQLFWSCHYRPACLLDTRCPGAEKCSMKQQWNSGDQIVCCRAWRCVCFITLLAVVLMQNRGPVNSCLLVTP